MAAFFPDLDLSLVVIDDTIPPTPGGIDAVSDEIDDSVHTVEEEVKDPSAEVFIQSTPEGLATPVVLFVADGLSITDGSSTADLFLSNAPPS